MLEQLRSRGHEKYDQRHRSGRGWAVATWWGVVGTSPSPMGREMTTTWVAVISRPAGEDEARRLPPSRCRPASFGALVVVVVIFILPVFSCLPKGAARVRLSCLNRFPHCLVMRRYDTKVPSVSVPRCTSGVHPSPRTLCATLY